MLTERAMVNVKEAGSWNIFTYREKFCFYYEHNVFFTFDQTLLYGCKYIGANVMVVPFGTDAMNICDCNC